MERRREDMPCYLLVLRSKSMELYQRNIRLTTVTVSARHI